MSIAVNSPGVSMRRVMWDQGLLAGAGAVVSLSIAGSSSAAFAALYGGAAALTSAWWLGRGFALPAVDDTAVPRRLLGRAAQRFVLVGAAFAFGIGPLGLPAAAMVCTFAVCQLSFALALRR